MFWRHLLGYAPVHIVLGLVGFATISLFTRLLAPDDYGRYALAFAAAQMVQLGCFTWLHAGMARYYEGARQAGSLGRHFGTAYAAFAAAAACVAAAVAAVHALVPIPPGLVTPLAAGLVAILLRALLMMGVETHRAARNIHRVAALEISQALLGLALGVLLIVSTPLDAAAPLAGMALACGACLLADLPTVRRLAGEWRLDRTELRRLVRFGAPVSLTLLLEATLGAADRFMIAAFLGDAAVGLYAATQSLAARTLDVIFYWVGSAAVPLAVAALERDGPDAARAVLRRNADALVLIALPSAVGLAMISENLLALVVGPEFRSAGISLLPWFAAAALMNGTTIYYFRSAFTLAERTRLMALCMAVPAVLNVALNYLLIPRMGLAGAVTATVAAYACGMLLCAMVGRRVFRMPLPLGTLVKGVAATGTMALGLAVIPVPEGAVGVLVQIAAGVTIYVPTALLLDLGGCRGWRGLSRPASAG